VRQLYHYQVLLCLRQGHAHGQKGRALCPVQERPLLLSRVSESRLAKPQGFLQVREGQHRHQGGRPELLQVAEQQDHNEQAGLPGRQHDVLWRKQQLLCGLCQCGHHRQQVQDRGCQGGQRDCHQGLRDLLGKAGARVLYHCHRGQERQDRAARGEVHPHHPRGGQVGL